MVDPFCKDSIDHATKVVAAHLRLQNPQYAKLEYQMKVIPAPSVTLMTDVIRQMEGNARILIVAWSAQGEIKNVVFSFVTTGYE